MDPKVIFVHAPSAVVFLCGGELSKSSAPTPSSIRDSFLRLGPPPGIKRYQVILAEDAEAYNPRNVYTDLLSFESDIAQISELVLLFSESPGSFTELGAFSMDSEISARMLAVIEHFYYIQGSFIRHGPLSHLEKKHGETAVCVLDGDELKIRVGVLQGAPDIKSIDLSLFKERIFGAAGERLSQLHEPSPYNLAHRGHTIKLIVGLIQECGGLTLDEIHSLLLLLLSVDIEKADIERYLLCAEVVRWIVREKRGLRTYYFALPMPQAMQFTFVDGAPHKDRRRWRLDIREHWRKTDAERHGGIVKAVLGGPAP